jgi:hypothetical protein
VKLAGAAGVGAPIVEGVGTAVVDEVDVVSSPLPESDPLPLPLLNPPSVSAVGDSVVDDGGAGVGTAIVPAVGVEVGLVVATVGGGATVGDDGADVGVAVGAPVWSMVTVRICDE